MQSFQFFTHMQGQVFVIFYACIGFAFFAYCMLVRQQTDQSLETRKLEPEVDPDPYQFAYLRGGENEVLRTAALELYAMGILKKEKGKIGVAKWKLDESATIPDSLSIFARKLSPFFQRSRKPSELFTIGPQWSNEFSETFRKWNRWIEDHGLRVSVGQQTRLTATSLSLAGVFFALGGIKIWSALSREIHNVGFAVALGLVGSIAIVMTCVGRRFNARGRAFVRDTQMINSQHKHKLRTMSAEDVVLVPSNQNGTNMVPLMAMGIFGVAALNGSPFSDFRKTYHAAEANGGGCGASCGGSTGASSCGGGSGCGGGGGGCGGGGCGGCGGS